MSETFIIATILQLTGVGVIIAEIILPTGGILSIIACGVFGYSLYIVFTGISTTVGFTFAAGDLVLIPVLVIIGIKLLAKSPATLRKTLSREDGVSSQSPELDKFQDMDGTAVTNLRPAGTAVIDGRRVDVVTQGEYLEKDTVISVYSVTGNQIIVRKKED